MEKSLLIPLREGGCICDVGKVRVYNWMKPYICYIFPALLVAAVYWVIRLYY